MDSVSRLHVLVAVLGRTPQIITETLYGLCVQRGVPIQEVVIFTTKEGRKQVTENLLEGKKWLNRLIEDYPQHFSHFKISATKIVVCKHSGNELSDIRNADEYHSFVETLISHLRQLTMDNRKVVHCSMAGGRKTMSADLAMVLQFMGRPQDKLYHVLISPSALENNPEFYYPPNPPQTFLLKNGEPFSTDAAHVDLLDIPYVRLRSKMLHWFGSREMAFQEMVEKAQEELQKMPDVPSLTVDCHNRNLISGTTTISLSPFEFSVYYYYVEKNMQASDKSTNKLEFFEAPEGEFFPQQSLNRLIGIYGDFVSAGMLLRFKTSLDNGYLPFQRILQVISKIKRKLATALDDRELVLQYGITNTGRYRKRYGIKLDKAKFTLLQ